MNRGDIKKGVYGPMHDCYIFNRFWDVDEVGGGGGLAVCRVQVLSCHPGLIPPLLRHCARATASNYMSLFCSVQNSIQSELSGLCLASLSSHIRLWSIWWIYNRGMIANHFIPCRETVLREYYNSNAPPQKKFSPKAEPNKRCFVKRYLLLAPWITLALL